MIYIYAHKATNRLKYTLKVVLKTILQVDYKLVDKDTFLEDSEFPKINYSDEKIKNFIWIKPHSLLFEKDIKTQNIAVTHINEIPFFFKTSDTADFQFDILASSFFMLSRYEEYLPYTLDEHARFSAEYSLAFKANFLQKPVVHLWAKQLRDAILKQKPNFLFPTRIYTQVNSIDIDIAYAYKGKPFVRRLGSFAKAMLRIDLKEMKQHLLFIFKRNDPYDTYSTLKKLQEKSTAKNIFFIQVGKHGQYDKNLPLNKVMKKLIKKLSKYAEIGIHPSYNSNTDLKTLRKEKQDLSEIFDKDVVKSRQHYLKMRFPDTYENLISVGITSDYTMGFSDKIGFRAGMAISYSFFNLQMNKERPLRIVPFQVMDGTLKDYLKLSPEEAIEQLNQIKSEIRAVNGQFISIFHNSFLTNTGEFEGWLDVYKQLLQ